MRISDGSSDVCSSDLADIEPEAGSPQSRSQPRARARRPAGEQITVCLGPLKKLIPESSVEGLPVAIGIVIVFQLACRNALLPFGQALPRLLDHPACPDRKSTRLNSSH